MITLFILQCGICEWLKAGMHMFALVTVVTCAAYNLSAWLVRCQRYLAINAIVYGVVVVWEFKHVRYHFESFVAIRALRLPAFTT